MERGRPAAGRGRRPQRAAGRRRRAGTAPAGPGRAAPAGVPRVPPPSPARLPQRPPPPGRLRAAETGRGARGWGRRGCRPLRPAARAPGRRRRSRTGHGAAKMPKWRWRKTGLAPHKVEHLPPVLRPCPLRGPVGNGEQPLSCPEMRYRRPWLSAVPLYTPQTGRMRERAASIRGFFHFHPENSRLLGIPVRVP